MALFLIRFLQLSARHIAAPAGGMLSFVTLFYGNDGTKFPNILQVRENFTDVSLGKPKKLLDTCGVMRNGWILGYVSAVDSNGRTMWIVDAPPLREAFRCASGRKAERVLGTRSSDSQKLY